MSYKRLGDYIKKVNVRNTGSITDKLLGINIDNYFMPSVANVIGTNLSRYKLVYKNQFACNRMHVGRDLRIPIALSKNTEPFMVSPAYDVFEVKRTKELLPDYLMMWMKRPEFDRECTFHTDADVRGGLSWKDFCDLTLPIPSTEKQREIVADYQAVENKIKTNEAICEKMEETAQTIYRRWFEEFEFPNEEGKPYKSNGGKMVWNEELEKEVPEGWEVKKLEDISTITMGQSPKGSTYNEAGNGMVFYQGRTDFGFRVPSIRTYTTNPKRKAITGDVLMSVRAPVGDLNIAKEDCCIGRGLAAIRSDKTSYVFYLMKNFKQLFDSNKGTGTIFSSINKSELHQLSFIFNERIAMQYNHRIKELDESILQYSKQINTLQRLQSLLLGRMTKKDKSLANFYYE